jgi:hypothetical protein
MARSRIKRLHVSQHVIRANKKNGTDDPVISVKVGDDNHYGSTVDIAGPSRVIYSPGKPLSCGARVWVETRSRVFVDGREVE